MQVSASISNSQFELALIEFSRISIRIFKKWVALVCYNSDERARIYGLTFLSASLLNSGEEVEGENKKPIAVRFLNKFLIYALWID